MNLNKLAENNGICIHKIISYYDRVQVLVDKDCNYYGEGNPRKCNANQCPEARRMLRRKKK